MALSKDKWENLKAALTLHFAITTFPDSWVAESHTGDGGRNCGSCLEFGGTDSVRIVLALTASLVGALLLMAVLFLLVYDSKKTAGMSFTRRLDFCFRQICSPWPWR